jgi:hypothetical protein
MLLAAVGMFAFPFGTIFGIYVLIVMGARVPIRVERGIQESYQSDTGNTMWLRYHGH